MEEAVRPNEEAFEVLYERGCRTWAALWETAVSDTTLPPDELARLYSVLLNHRYFTGNLIDDNSISNTVTVSGKTTWTTTRGLCDLSSFQEEVVILVASSCPTTVIFVCEPPPPMTLLNCFNQHSNHIPVLMLAWKYILSTRWAELIPGASAPDYTSRPAWLNVRNAMTELDEDCF